jgi:hypothetical protein
LLSRQSRTEVASSLCHGRDHTVEHQACALAHCFIAHEEKRPILAAVQFRCREGTTDAPAKLITLKDITLEGEEVPGIELVIAQKFEENAVELAGAGLGRSVQGAAGIAKLRRVFALLNLELLKGINRCLDERATLMVVSDINTIDIEGRLASAYSSNCSSGFLVLPDPK